MTLCVDPQMAKLIAHREMMVSGAPEALDIALRHQLISEQTSIVIVHERDAANMALGVPVHTSVDHMASMNFARCVSLSTVMHSFPGSAGASQHGAAVRFSASDDAGSDAQGPALWRTASVAREDITPLDENGGRFDIPDFLRKQAEPDTLEESYVAALPAASPARSLKRFNDILEKRIDLEDALDEWLRTAKLPLVIQLLWTNQTPAKVNAIIAATLLHMNALVGNQHVQLNARAFALLRQLLEEEYGRVNVLTDPRLEVIRQTLEGVTAENWPVRHERAEL